MLWAEIEDHKGSLESEWMFSLADPNLYLAGSDSEP